MLKGRCALITGSTQGLGYAMAERLAAEGCNIVMNGFGETGEIESRRRKLESAHGVRAIHHGADVAERRADRRPRRDGAQDVRRGRRADQQRRGALLLADRGVQARGLGPRAGGEPVGRVPHRPAGAARHARARLRPHRQRRLGLRPVRHGEPSRLRHHQDRADRLHPRHRARDGAHTTSPATPSAPARSRRPTSKARLEAERAKSGQSREEAERAFLATRQPSGKFVAPDRVAALVALLCGPSGADITGSAIPIDGGWSASLNFLVAIPWLPA